MSNEWERNEWEMVKAIGETRTTPKQDTAAHPNVFRIHFGQIDVGHVDLAVRQDRRVQFHRLLRQPGVLLGRLITGEES